MESTGGENNSSPHSVRIVPYWHTAVLLVVLLGLSALNAGSAQSARADHSHLRIYLATIIYEWLLTGFVWWGLRRSGGTLRQLIGGRWEDVGDFLLDFAIGGATWIAAMMALALVALAMGMGHADNLEQARRQLGFLAPQSSLEMVVWVCLSATAGFCEEILFRGYLQRQFTHMLRSRWVALIVVSILFGLGHGYEGWQRMVLIALLGLVFGIISLARHSLRPAMMAHTMQDTISGLLLRTLTSRP
jgi:CAAX protease family protein